MRKTAGFLKFGYTIALVAEVIVALILAALEVFLLVIGNFSDLAAKAGAAIVINEGKMTPAEMDALKPVIMIALGVALIAVLMAIWGTVKTRIALGECQQERPFSERCISALKDAARIQIIGGIIGIAGSVFLSLKAAQLTVNGVSVSNSSYSLNLSFLINAVEMYLFYHVAKYGSTLENR